MGITNNVGNNYGSINSNNLSINNSNSLNVEEFDLGIVDKVGSEGIDYSKEIGNGLFDSESSSNASQRSNVVDSNGNVIGYSIKGNDGKEQIYSLNGMLSYEKNPDGSFKWYAEDGILAGEQYTDGTKKYYHYNLNREYNGYGIENNDGSYVSFNKNGIMEQVNYKDGRLISYKSDGTIEFYDSNGLMTNKTLPDGTKKSYYYDSNGEVGGYQVSRPDGTYQTYNGQGQVDFEKKLDGTSVSYHYGSDGNLTGGRTETYADGTSTIFEKNRNISSYDSSGNLIKTTSNIISSPNVATTRPGGGTSTVRTSSPNVATTTRPGGGTSTARTSSPNVATTRPRTVTSTTRTSSVRPTNANSAR